MDYQAWRTAWNREKKMKKTFLISLTTCVLHKQPTHSQKLRWQKIWISSMLLKAFSLQPEGYEFHTFIILPVTLQIHILNTYTAIMSYVPIYLHVCWNYYSGSILFMLFGLHEKLEKSFWRSLSWHISSVLCITISVKYGKKYADENQNETKQTQSVLSDSVVGGTLNKPRGWICSLR